MNFKKFHKIFSLLLMFSVVLLAGGVVFAENIDPDNNDTQYAWCENVGWINAEPLGDGGPGMDVGDADVIGYLWGENIGWISLSCLNTGSCGTVNYGVDNDGFGNLSGYAWGENVGWINFAPTFGGVTIDPLTGVFSGYAWGENIGWCNFAPTNGGVKTSWVPCTMTFPDVSPSHWAYSYIEAIFCAGITIGYPDNTYRPGNPVNRAQMATFIIRAIYGESFSYSSTRYFPDVPASHWAFKYVQRLYEDGITIGFPDGTYRPETNVSRAQMAAFLIRTFYGESFSYSSTRYFPDVSASHWAFKYVQRLYEDGITIGYGDGTYRPETNVSRAQMAAFLARAFLGMP